MLEHLFNGMKQLNKLCEHFLRIDKYFSKIPEYFFRMSHTIFNGLIFFILRNYCFTLNILKNLTYIMLKLMIFFNVTQNFYNE